MPSVGSIVSNIAVCCLTGLASRWLTPALPACPGCPTCPTCPGCPGSPATPANPATPNSEATESGWQWNATYLVAATVLSSLGPRRIVFWLNYLVARFENQPEEPEERAGPLRYQRQDALRAIAGVGPGAVQRGRPGGRLALAPAAHPGGGGTYGWG